MRFKSNVNNCRYDTSTRTETKTNNEIVNHRVLIYIVHMIIIDDYDTIVEKI